MSVAICGGVTLTFEGSVPVPDSTVAKTGFLNVGHNASTGAGLLALAAGLLSASGGRRSGIV